MKKIKYVLPIGLITLLLGCGIIAILKYPVTISTPTPVKKILTKAQFDQFENGMTYKEITNILGEKGEIQAQSQDGTLIDYMFKGEGDIRANAQLIFQDGKLFMKSQAGLR